MRGAVKKTAFVISMNATLKYVYSLWQMMQRLYGIVHFLINVCIGLCQLYVHTLPLCIVVQSLDIFPHLVSPTIYTDMKFKTILKDSFHRANIRLHKHSCRFMSSPWDQYIILKKSEIHLIVRKLQSS